MMNIDTVEGLMLFLINLFGEHFPQSAILKGGMTLRLLDSPRYTNDLDYVFIPYKSKKDIKQGVLALLDSVDDLNYTYNMNSKCLRIKIEYNQIHTQVEINVAEECQSTSTSTASMAAATGQLSRIIRVMDYSVAMAHKLAAWNERQLVRDLYDLYYYYAFLTAIPDIGILQERLKSVASTPRNKNPKTMTLEQLIEKLRDKLERLNAGQIQEMADYLPADNLPGLELKLKSNLLKLCNELEQE